MTVITIKFGMRNRVRIVLWATIAAWSSAACSEPRCRDLLVHQNGLGSASMRGITPTDLARLRDIGSPDSGFGDQSPLSISPNGLEVAFTLQQAVPASNSYCMALALVSLAGAHRLELLDTGGEPVRFLFNDLRGMVFPTGSQVAVHPEWSPDGRRIAYLKRVGGSTQVWIAAAKGGRATQLSHMGTDINAVRWTADGTYLAIETLDDLSGERKRIAREAKTGYHYDARIMPLVGPAPYPRGPLPTVSHCIDLRDHEVRSTACKNLFSPDDQARASRNELNDVQSVDISSTDPNDFAAPSELRLTSHYGQTAICSSDLCHGKLLASWSNGGIAYYFRRDGWAGTDLSLYRVKGFRGEPERILTGPDQFTGCQRVREELVCIRESAARPREIVTLDPDTGSSALVFDPNPEYARIELGQVVRLSWSSDNDVQNFGDLVLPPWHHPGQRHPMIVVQYTSRGFLRGGTGDEYPIFALAQQGFAVLSFQRPPPYAESVTGKKYRDWLEAEPENVRNWNERRNLLAALLGGVETAVATGTVDGSRLGLTGMSDGASTAQFALVNAPIFSAVSLSSCCEDPATLLALGGPAFAEERERAGWPKPASSDISFWKPYSLELNAVFIKTPILMQLPSDEYEEGIESYDALRSANRVVDMYVFDNEHHVKDQPIHRLSIYERNMRWFAFWLLGEKNCVKTDLDCLHWRQLENSSSSN